MSKILALNWKMNPTNLSDAVDLLDEYYRILQNQEESLIVFPPQLFVSDLFEYAQGLEITSLAIGVQDISGKENGAFTSQISAEMAESVGAECALIGHSETRLYQQVTDEDCSQKVSQAVANNLIPVLCVGHGMQEKIDLELLKTQIVTAFLPIHNQNNITSIIIAYEPVWAIGTGKTASVEHINQVALVIQNILEQNLPLLSQTTQILYGGSVKAANIEEIVKSNVDGFLVGASSLNPNEVKELLKVCAKN